MSAPVGYTQGVGGFFYRNSDGTGPYLLNPDSTISQALPRKIYTDRDGASARLRVDPGQTGFFAGRMFRTYTEQVIPVAGPAVQFRFVAPVDFVLWSQILVLLQGAVRLQIYTGATPSGVWTELPIIGVNRMAERPQPYYVPLCTVATGGDFTGGIEVVDAAQLTYSLFWEERVP